jgi:hypothetical protein
MSSHGTDYEDRSNCPIGCDVVLARIELLTIHKNMLHP